MTALLMALSLLGPVAEPGLASLLVWRQSASDVSGRPLPIDAFRYRLLCRNQSGEYQTEIAASTISDRGHAIYELVANLDAILAEVPDGHYWCDLTSIVDGIASAPSNSVGVLKMRGLVFPDADGDKVLDAMDNCIFAENAGQQDTDGDGYGNRCDPDFNNNGVVDPFDVSSLKSAFASTTSPDQDLNGNGVVDAFDLSILKSSFGGAPGPSCCTDADGDGILDGRDNCTLAANVNQQDSDGDGYGNRCDPDFNDNGVVDPFDVSSLKSAFASTTSPDQDLNGNGVVDAFDLSILKSSFGKAPGPSCCAPSK